MSFHRNCAIGIGVNHRFFYRKLQVCFSRPKTIFVFYELRVNNLRNIMWEKQPLISEVNAISRLCGWVMRNLLSIQFAKWWLMDRGMSVLLGEFLRIALGSLNQLVKTSLGEPERWSLNTHMCNFYVEERILVRGFWNAASLISSQ